MLYVVTKVRTGSDGIYDCFEWKNLLFHKYTMYTIHLLSSPFDLSTFPFNYFQWFFMINVYFEENGFFSSRLLAIFYSKIDSLMKKIMELLLSWVELLYQTWNGTKNHCYIRHYISVMMGITNGHCRPSKCWPSLHIYCPVCCMHIVFRLWICVGGQSAS